MRQTELSLKKRKPQHFLLGAPKCGTTALVPKSFVSLSIWLNMLHDAFTLGLLRLSIRFRWVWQFTYTLHLRMSQRHRLF